MTKVIAGITASVNYNDCIPSGMLVEPGCCLLLQVDASMAASAGEEGIAAGVGMRKLCAWSLVGAPPGVVDKIAAHVIENGIVNRRWGEPVR